MNFPMHRDSRQNSFFSTCSLKMVSMLLSLGIVLQGFFACAVEPVTKPSGTHPLPGQEQVPAKLFVAIAYGAIWLVLFLWILSMAWKQMKLGQKISKLEHMIEMSR